MWGRSSGWLPALQVEFRAQGVRGRVLACTAEQDGVVELSITYHSGGCNKSDNSGAIGKEGMVRQKQQQHLQPTSAVLCSARVTSMAMVVVELFILHARF